MEELLQLYQEMGISPAVYAYGENAIERLRDRFAAIDQVAEYNQAKVLRAMQKNRVSAACFAASSGYGLIMDGRVFNQNLPYDALHSADAVLRAEVSVLIVVDGGFDDEEVGGAFRKNVLPQSERAGVGTGGRKPGGDFPEIAMRIFFAKRLYYAPFRTATEEPL